MWNGLFAIKTQNIGKSYQKEENFTNIVIFLTVFYTNRFYRLRFQKEETLIKTKKSGSEKLIKRPIIGNPSRKIASAIF